MHTKPRKFLAGLAIVAAVLTAAVVGGSIVGAQQEPKVKPGPSTPVAITSPLPVPITGDVTATVDEVDVVNPEGEALDVATAEGVELGVDVESLEQRLDDVAAALDDVTAAADGPEPADRRFAYAWRCNDCKDGPEASTVLAHLIVIDSNDDTFLLRLFGPALGNTTPIFTWGNYGNPSDVEEVAIPLTQPIEVNRMDLVCRNLVEECEVDVQVIGSSRPIGG